MSPDPVDLKTLLFETGTTRAAAAGMVHMSLDGFIAGMTPSTSRKSRRMSLAAYELLLLKLDRHPDARLVPRLVPRSSNI